ncbi:MAG: hypothetical protein ACO3L4_01350 [Candidatus Puniceispirillaceae bacterium]
MLKKISITNQKLISIKSPSWLISILIHASILIGFNEAYKAKIRDENNGFKAIEFVVYQPKTPELPKKELPKDNAETTPKTTPKTAPKTNIISNETVSYQSRFMSETGALSKTISVNKLKTIPKPKPKPLVVAKQESPREHSSQKIAIKNYSSSNLTSKKTERRDKITINDEAVLNSKSSIRFKTPDPPLLHSVKASEWKPPTDQINLKLDKKFAVEPDGKQIQSKIFRTEAPDNLHSIINKKTGMSEHLKDAPKTRAQEKKSNLITNNQLATAQSNFSTPKAESARKKKLLKNWATAVRNDIVERTLKIKLSHDVKISFKISNTGEILSIEIIGASETDTSVENLVRAIRASGRFPSAPVGLELDFANFPVKLRSSS